MGRLKDNATHSSIPSPPPRLVITILAGILTTCPVIAQTEDAKITASDAAEGDRFGFSVSVSDDPPQEEGSVAVIGAYRHDDAGSDSGSAYVYRYDKSSRNWIEDAKLTASDASEDDRFGYSVSVSADLVAIGAWSDGDAGTWSGSAYVYRYDPLSGNWIEEAKLTASDAEESDFFGWSVAVSGGLALIGAWGDDDAGSDSGSAYAYRYDPPSEKWIEQAKLTASDAEPGDQFGISVSVSGDLALIGAYLDDDAGNDAGSAYVYRYDPPSAKWIQEAKLSASDGAAHDWFGHSVSISGDLAVIGAFADDDAGSRSGSAYVYRYDPPSGNWIEQAKLTASDGAADDHFGYSVSISSNPLEFGSALAVIGAYRDDDAGSRSGSAYMYRYDPPSGDWLEQAKLTASDASADDDFGISVSVGSTGIAMIGAYRDDDAGSDSGSTYAFDLCLALAGDLDCDGDVDRDDFAIFLDCVTGPGGGLPTDCLPADIDTDGDVDWADFALFQTAFSQNP